jgi:hypothetical protein
MALKRAQISGMNEKVKEAKLAANQRHPNATKRVRNPAFVAEIAT